jgi:hypothetical protein
MHELGQQMYHTYVIISQLVDELKHGKGLSDTYTIACYPILSLVYEL